MFPSLSFELNSFHPLISTCLHCLVIHVFPSSAGLGAVSCAPLFTFPFSCCYYFPPLYEHQDAKKSISRLSVPSQLNIRMDSLTKDLLDVLSPIDCSNLPAHRHSFMLPSYENKPVYQKFKTQLYDSIMNSKAHEYWISEKKRYTKEDIPHIDWDAQYKALRTINGTRQRTLSKWFSGWIASEKTCRDGIFGIVGAAPFAENLMRIKLTLCTVSIH